MSHKAGIAKDVTYSVRLGISCLDRESGSSCRLPRDQAESRCDAARTPLWVSKTLSAARSLMFWRCDTRWASERDASRSYSLSASVSPEHSGPHSAEQ